MSEEFPTNPFNSQEEHVYIITSLHFSELIASKLLIDCSALPESALPKIPETTKTYKTLKPPVPTLDALRTNYNTSSPGDKYTKKDIENAGHLLVQLEMNPLLFNQVSLRAQVGFIFKNYGKTSFCTDRSCAVLLGTSHGRVNKDKKCSRSDEQHGRKCVGRPYVVKPLTLLVLQKFVRYVLDQKFAITMGSLMEVIKTVQHKYISRDTLRKIITKDFNLKMVSGTPKPFCGLTVEPIDIINNYISLSKYNTTRACLVFNISEISLQDDVCELDKKVEIMLPKSVDTDTIKVGIGKVPKRISMLTMTSLDGKSCCTAFTVLKDTVALSVAKEFDHITFMKSETGYVTQEIFEMWVLNFVLKTISATKTQLGLSQKEPSLILMSAGVHTLNTLKRHFNINNIFVHTFHESTENVVDPFKLCLYEAKMGLHMTNTSMRECAKLNVIKDLLSTLCEKEVNLSKGRTPLYSDAQKIVFGNVLGTFGHSGIHKMITESFEQSGIVTRFTTLAWRMYVDVSSSQRFISRFKKYYDEWVEPNKDLKDMLTPPVNDAETLPVVVPFQERSIEERLKVQIKELRGVLSGYENIKTRIEQSGENNTPQNAGNLLTTHLPLLKPNLKIENLKIMTDLDERDLKDLVFEPIKENQSDVEFHDM
ncbi:hypothetical protein EIN_370310 [Entamoeba invadens IP1]|uniref:Uncharacterized protein n=1 Tax=Entamoeba invadens IP1 TaxID=370355 RepID=A0A0A1UFH8_ENTIV|nr:hypothetical protein EIN_370310 [Entamoeba invadens IP1]ELP92679.1 hypothetical protein EIN_370310 [Entamoeba invadens IP1]|eukprot:XP_004259450.1 hypothetical protein EIN_370310 [Entamoeba invadens IP1]